MKILQKVIKLTFFYESILSKNMQKKKKNVKKQIILLPYN